MASAANGISWRRVSNVQFIAGLGDPQSSAGSNAAEWGIWPVDPGPRGVAIGNFTQLEARGGVAPAGWTHDPQDWWVEEYGRMMEKPDFPLATGRYLVTGDREVTTVLTVSDDGMWSLADGAVLYDITHLPCRAARYTPVTEAGSPANAKLTDFPVTPGALMPVVEGCKQLDYAVIFVIAIAEGEGGEDGAKQ